jgi:hypothetical protein
MLLPNTTLRVQISLPKKRLRAVNDYLGFSKKLENLEAACAMFLAYYNFVWRTHDVLGERTRLPAAMAAGVVKTLMSFEDLFDVVMGEGYAMAA